MKKSSKLLPVAAMALLFAIPAQADFVGFTIGAAYWAPELSGDVSSKGDPDIDLSDDLGLDDPSETTLVLTLEHPVPFLPNFRYQGIELDSSGRERLSGSITFEGETYVGSETVSSDLDLSHDDLVLYYEVLDNWINLDIGLDIKRFDGEVSIVGSTNTTATSIDIDETIPLLYLSARFDLPFSGFYVGADISTLSSGDNSVEDTTILLGYESKIGLGIEGGLKTFSVELDDADDLGADLEYDGAFVNGFFHF